MRSIRTVECVTYAEWENFETIACCNCGIPFGVPSMWKESRLEDKVSFFCPNGHRQSYTKSTAQKLRERLEAKESELAKQKHRAEVEKVRTYEARRQRDRTRKSHRKMRDRVNNGVCPCCNRTFQNLLKHMRTQHPEQNDSQSLRQLREMFGMTQADLAEETGVQAQHVSLFECGKSVTVWARDQIEAWMQEQGASE